MAGIVFMAITGGLSALMLATLVLAPDLQPLESLARYMASYTGGGLIGAMIAIASLLTRVDHA